MAKMDMKMLRWVSLGLVVTALWAVVVSFLTSSFEVGLRFAPGQKGGVALVSLDADGGEKTGTCMPVGSDGCVSFGLLRQCETFRFQLHPENGKGRFLLHDVTLWGVNLLSSEQIARFQIKKPLKWSPPDRAGCPIVIDACEGDVFDLPNAFPYVVKMLSNGFRIVAFVPLAVWGVLMLALLLGRRLMRAAVRILDSRTLYALFLCTVLMLTLPMPVFPVMPGLDPSWIWLMNKFAFSGRIGTDLVFTYGPLGFLVAPQLTLLNVVCGVSVNLMFIGALGCLLLLLRESGKSDSVRVVLLGLPFLWLLTWPNGMEWRWCAVSVILLAVASLARRVPFSLVLVALAALFTVIQSFIKFSSFVSVVGQQMFILGYCCIRRRRAAIPYVLVFTGTAFFSAASLAMVLFPSFSALLDWFIGSKEIAAGYNLYMITDKSVVELSLPIVLLISIFFEILFRKRVDRRDVFYWLMWSPLLFCLAKYALVRQNVAALAVAVAWMSLLWNLFVELRVGRSVALASVCVAIAVAAEVFLNGNGRWLAVSAENFFDTIRPRHALQRAMMRDRPALEASRLSEGWRKLIGTNGVLIADCDMAPAMLGDLNLVPFAATQIYSAYTPYLDAKCASSVAVDDCRATFLLVPADPQSFDSRNFYFDNPRFWRVVRSHYRYVDRQGKFILLKRKAKEDREIESTRSFCFKRTVLGKVKALLFRPEKAAIVIDREDESRYCCALNPEIFDVEPVPSVLPTTVEEVVSYFGGVSTNCPHVTDVRLLLPDGEVVGDVR